MFVEGMETAEKEIVLDLRTESMENIHSEIMKVEAEPHGVKQEHIGEAVKDHTGVESTLRSPTNTTLKSPLKSPLHSSQESVSKPDNRDTGVVSSGSNKVAEPNSTQTQATQQRLNNAYIPSAASRNALEIQRIENLFRNEAPTSKTGSTQQNHSNAARPQEHNSWFNLLPRMPCDESSLTLSHTQHSGNFVPTYSKRGGDMDITSTPPPLKRPPGRPPRISNPSDSSAGSTSVARDVTRQSVSIQYLPQLPVKRPPGRPPKSSYQTFNLTYMDGQLGGTVPTSTEAASTQSMSTMSLSFEELKKNVLESLMQEPAPIPPGE